LSKKKKGGKKAVIENSQRAGGYLSQKARLSEIKEEEKTIYTRKDGDIILPRKDPLRRIDGLLENRCPKKEGKDRLSLEEESIFLVIYPRSAKGESLSR